MLPGQVVTIGDSRLPAQPGEIPIGGLIRQGNGYGPFCRVICHGPDTPFIMLATGRTPGGLLLESAFAVRKRLGYERR